MSDRQAEYAKFRERVAGELAKLTRQDGSIDPHDVRDYAATHKRSALHSMFEWDNGAAADEYRLLQARQIIKKYYVVVEDAGDDDETILISVPSRRRTGEGSYMRPADIESNNAFLESCYSEVCSKLLSFEKTYGHLLTRLEPVWKAIRKNC